MAVLITANGWGRDHGTRELIVDDLNKATVTAGSPFAYKDHACLQVVRSTAGAHLAQTNIVISKGAPLKLNGDYAVHVELSQSEIARLFYLTHADKDLHHIVGIFAEFKQEQDEAARRKEVEAAKRKVRRI